MANTTVWLIFSISLITTNFVGGSLLALCIGIGAMGGAVASWMGFDTSVQLLCFVVEAALTILFWQSLLHFGYREKEIRKNPKASPPNFSSATCSKKG